MLTPDPSAGPPDPLRPAWLPQLAAALDSPSTGVARAGATAALMQDPRWPAVITAITRASEHGIPYTDLFRYPTGPDGEPVPAHALADALIYRATVLTDPAPYDPTDPDRRADRPRLPGRRPAIPRRPVRRRHRPTGGPAHGHHPRTATTRPAVTVVPDNLAEPPLDYSDPNDWRTAPLAPLDEETIPAGLVALTEAEIEQELFHAATRRAGFVWEPSDQQQERALARIADAEFAPVSPERIAALNEQATVFYQAAYRGSWAQTYLTERLGGTDLTGDLRVRPGYAPRTWTALTDHLRRHGATDEELLAAGLAKQASTGRLIDAFRDRLILPIHTTVPGYAGNDADAAPALQVVGFVGRRHPDQDERRAGRRRTRPRPARST